VIGGLDFQYFIKCIQAQKSITFIPFTQNDDFVNREGTLKNLDRLLNQSTHHAAAIWGLGGCG
jgi:hypothetical protein